MKIKVLRTNESYSLALPQTIDLKRDGGFQTAQVNFIADSKDVTRRLDRIELLEETPLTYPIIMQIGATDRTFTSNILTWNQTLAGVVYSYYVKISIFGNTLKIDEATVAYVIGDTPFLQETTINVRAIKKLTTVLWSGNVNVGKNYEFALTLPTTVLSQWVVSKNTRTLTDYTSRWLYTIELVDSAKLLQGVVMPNMAFTQSLNGTLTLADVVIKVLKKCKAKLWQFRNQTDFTLSSAGATKLNILAPDDIYNNKTLLDFLIRVGQVIDAFPVVKDWSEIDFRYFNTSTSTISPTYISVELTDDLENFATEIVMDAENVDLGGGTLTYPNALDGAFAMPQSLNETLVTGLLTASEAMLELPQKIKRIKQITMIRFIEVLEENFEAPILDQQWVFTENDGIVEKAVYDVLAAETFWSFIPYAGHPDLKKNNCYYEYGTNKIFNLQNLLTREAIINVAISEVAFIVEYEPLIAAQITRKNTVETEFEWQEYQNQEERTVDRYSTIKKMEADIRRKGSSVANVVYKSTTFPTLNTRINVLGDFYTITRMVIQVYYDYYKVSASASSDFTLESLFVSVDREPRKYEIPSKQIVERVVRLNKRYKINVSNLGQSLTNPSATYLTISGVISFLYPLIKDISTVDDYKKGSFVAMCQWRYNTESNGQNAIATVLSTSYVYATKRLSILFGMRDNTSVDFFKRFNATVGTWPFLFRTLETVAGGIVDENGELESVDVKIIPVEYLELLKTPISETPQDLAEEYLRYTWPYVYENYFDNGYNLGDAIFEAINYTDENRIYLDKDRREKLNFQLDYDLVEGDNVVIYDGYTNNTAFFKGLDDGNTVEIKLQPLTGEIVSCSYDACEIIDVSPTARIRIKFTPNTGGGARDVNAILFYVNSELVLSKSFDNTPVTSTQQTIFVTIGDD